MHVCHCNPAARCPQGDGCGAPPGQVPGGTCQGCFPGACCGPIKMQALLCQVRRSSSACLPAAFLGCPAGSTQRFRRAHCRGGRPALPSGMDLIAAHKAAIKLALLSVLVLCACLSRIHAPHARMPCRNRGPAPFPPPPPPPPAPCLPCSDWCAHTRISQSMLSSGAWLHGAGHAAAAAPAPAGAPDPAAALPALLALSLLPVPRLAPPSTAGVLHLHHCSFPCLLRLSCLFHLPTVVARLFYRSLDCCAVPSLTHLPLRCDPPHLILSN